jgi:hypothetical protein
MDSRTARTVYKLVVLEEIKRVTARGKNAGDFHGIIAGTSCVVLEDLPKWIHYYGAATIAAWSGLSAGMRLQA